MPTHHIASWLLKHSDVPVAVLKPVATRIGVSTNHLGAALFAGQILYENQGTIVEYVDRGGVRVGQFLHGRAAERYGEDHALTEYLGENVAALDEAFEGSEAEATTFVEFYRQLRQVDRDTPDLSGAELLTAAKERMDVARQGVTDAHESVPDARGLMSDAKRAVGEGARNAASGAKDAVNGASERVGDATGAVGDPRERLRDLHSESDSGTDAVEIPVHGGE